ncbi:hypothetical protein [Paraherbaspirillum soli]|uniref:Tfp pilus assembly protein PilN n=1 Tax=Paraherbaspirillum soli TaxID=631222 RepID=A0ABW0M9K0_9BURK
MSALRKLDLDFGGRTSRPRPLGIALLAIGATAAIAALLQLSTAYSARQLEQSANDTLSARMRSFQSDDDSHVKVSPAQLQRYRNAAAVADQLRMPWDDLLKMLESAPMEHVALLSIEPIASRHQLRLAAEARDVSTMLDYLSYLQQQPTLHQVILSSHQIQRQAPGSPVRFQIQAQWSEK